MIFLVTGFLCDLTVQDCVSRKSLQYVPRENHRARLAGGVFFMAGATGFSGYWVFHAFHPGMSCSAKRDGVELS